MYRILVIDYSSENQVFLKKKLFNVKAIISYAGNLKRAKYYLNNYDFDLILFGTVKQEDYSIIEDYLQKLRLKSVVVSTSNSQLTEYLSVDGTLDLYVNDKTFITSLENLIHCNETKLINEGVELKCIHRNH